MDIYSYGLLLFTVVSNGHKPHEEITDPYEIDKAIEEVRIVERFNFLCLSRFSVPDLSSIYQ